ncbi:hypothetical protein LIA77_01303 [Sarocladium implicatum]|nr:hypothetical protein LIA77_01303 [Sarocladium implicatum]
MCQQDVVQTAINRTFGQHNKTMALSSGHGLKHAFHSPSCCVDSQKTTAGQRPLPRQCIATLRMTFPWSACHCLIKYSVSVSLSNTPFSVHLLHIIISTRLLTPRPTC